MARGRPKTPESLNKLHGNPGKRKSQTSPFTSKGLKLGVPHGLNKEVRKKCRELSRYLVDSGGPIELLRTPFELYCRHLQIAHEAYLKLKGNIVTGGKKNPAAQIWKDNSAEATKILAGFEKMLCGATPPEKKPNRLKAQMKKGAQLRKIKG